jgi:mannose-6-phosphate isomerase-like protein (cupin superfamily)
MSQQRVFLFDQFPVTDRQLPNGVIMPTRQVIKPNEPLAPDSPFNAVGVGTLNPGTALHYHQHLEDEEFYAIISGRGIYVDNEGKKHPVKSGDVTFCLRGEKHSLENPGPEPLVFCGVIVKNRK